MKIRTLTVCLLAACFVTQSAFAQISANLDYTTDFITVSGNVSKDEVQVVLIKPGFDVSDAEAAAASTDKSELGNVVEYFGQVSVKDNDIEAFIPMRSDAAKGKYVLVVGDEVSSVYFAHLTERQGDMVTEAKTAIASNTFSDFAVNNGKYFCDGNLYDSLTNGAKAAKYAADIMSKYGTLTGAEYVQKLSSALNTGIIMEALNENKIDDFSVIKSMTDDSAIKVPLDKVDLIADDKVKDVISQLSGKNFATEESYLKQLSETVFLNVILNGTKLSNDDKKVFFESYASKLGVNLTFYNQLTNNKKVEAMAKLSTSNSASFALLQSDLDEICKGAATVITQPSGGGGGGEGGIRATPSISDGGFSVGGTAGGKGLTDLSQCEWARPAVEYLTKINMISGYEDNTYKPLKNISRAEFTSIIARKYLPQNSYSGSFADVESGSWYASYVESAFNSGIISGKGDNAFVPNENISRQDIAVILVRLAKYLGHELSGSAEAFADDSAIEAYAKDAIYSLRSIGIINGDENGNFNPNAAATRAEAAQMIYGFLKILE